MALRVVGVSIAGVRINGPVVLVTYQGSAVIFGDYDVETVGSYRYLGVDINETLNYTPQALEQRF